ncbi:MAG TPA: nuclease A inhibitor family protein [Gemmataceae bacterium]|nr:nuclease A inhibitor family protein [Gemmataceae bacterium]
MPTNETTTALQQAAEGLTYQSETDAPWKAFAWPTAQGEPTAAAVRQQGRHKADAPVEEQTVEDFFAPLIQDQDWYGDEERATAAKYRALLDTVKRYLKDPKVMRVGTRKKAVYVVGTAKEGGWAGLTTTAVET